MTHRTAENALRPVAPTPVRRGPKPRFTEAEARDITQRIKRCANDLWLLVAQAHQRKAWLALGYVSWKAYVETELNMSESRAYQLLDAGKVVKVLAEVYGEDSSTLEAVPTSREAAKATMNLSLFRSLLRIRKAEGMTPDEALRAAVRDLPIPITTPRQSEENGIEDSKARHPAGKKAYRAPKAMSTLVVPKGGQRCPVCQGHGYLVPKQ